MRTLTAFTLPALTLPALTLTAMLCGVAATIDAAEGRPARPDVVIFIGDDHSITDLGCYGSPDVRTPRLDGLAAEGLRFTHAFTPTAMCSPSRSALYTGLFPFRNGCYMNHGSVKPGTRSLPHHLARLGYRVALAGKVHVKPRESFPFEYLRWGRKKGRVETGAVDAFLAERKRPFCLVIGSHDPHTPHASGGFSPDEVTVRPYLVDTPETRAYLADYLTDVERVDEEVGVALDLIERHGFDKRTLFIYVGDHGNGIFAKWTCYDMGIRVPFIVRWPGVVESGRVSDAMVSLVDVLPTLVEAAGAEPIEGLDGRSFLGVLQGKAESHRDHVFAAHTTRGIISGSDFPIRAVRTRHLKYIRNLAPDGVFTNVITHGRDRPAANKESKVGEPAPRWLSWVRRAEEDPLAAARVESYRRRPPEELYDLRTDPFELRNLIGDPRHEAEVKRLRKLLDEWMEAQGDRGLESERAVSRRRQQSKRRSRPRPRPRPRSRSRSRPRARAKHRDTE